VANQRQQKETVDARANGVGCLGKYGTELRFKKAGGWYKY